MRFCNCFCSIVCCKVQRGALASSRVLRLWCELRPKDLQFEIKTHKGNGAESEMTSVHERARNRYPTLTYGVVTVTTTMSAIARMVSLFLQPLIWIESLSKSQTDKEG